MNRLAGSALVAAVLVAVLVAVDAGGDVGSTPQTRHFYVKFLGSTNGTPSFKPGSTLTARSAIYDRVGGRRLGRTSELCTVVVRKPFTMQCSFSAILKHGTFTLAGGFNPSHTPYRVAIVGGTGRFAGARGVLRAASAKGSAEDWTIVFTK